jgi:hypothetical protein
LGAYRAQSPQTADSSATVAYARLARLRTVRTGLVVFKTAVSNAPTCADWRTCPTRARIGQEGLGGCTSVQHGARLSRGTPRTFPAPRRPAQPRPPGMTGHPCREGPARPGGPRRPARTGGSGPPGRRGRASGWTRIRRLGPGCPRAPRAFPPGPGRVPGTDQPYNVDHGECQHHRRGDEQNPEAEIGHQACLPSAGDGPYTGESVARHVLVTGGSKFWHD